MCASEISRRKCTEEAEDVENREISSTDEYLELEPADTNVGVKDPDYTSERTLAKNSIGNDFFKSLPSTYQFALLAGSMIILFSIHNVLQEAIMKIPDFKYGVMLGYMEVFG